MGYESIDVEMLLEYEIDYFKYDNCYPRLDGSSQCFGFPTENLLQNQNSSKGNLQACDDGCGAYIDFFASLRHLPSLWQSPSEESRFETYPNHENQDSSFVFTNADIQLNNETI